MSEVFAEIGGRGVLIGTTQGPIVVSLRRSPAIDQEIFERLAGHLREHGVVVLEASTGTVTINSSLPFPVDVTVTINRTIDRSFTDGGMRLIRPRKEAQWKTERRGRKW